jgi:hypothetical protein
MRRWNPTAMADQSCDTGEEGKETTNQPHKSEPSDEEAMEIDINKLECVLF